MHVATLIGDGPLQHVLAAVVRALWPALLLPMLACPVICCMHAVHEVDDLAWGELQIEGAQEHWTSRQLKALRQEANAQVGKGTPYQMLAGDTVTHTETCAMMDKPYCSGSIKPYLPHACHLPVAAPAICTMLVIKFRVIRQTLWQLHHSCLLYCLFLLMRCSRMLHATYCQFEQSVSTSH